MNLAKKIFENWVEENYPYFYITWLLLFVIGLMGSNSV